MIKIIATITSQFGSKNGYTGRPVSRIESYNIDSALDTDADQFSIDIGDPKSELVEILKRDSEVRISLSAADNKTITPLLKGYADVIGLTHDGVLSIAGRDLSASAIDDTAIPYNWHNARPKEIIMQQGKTRGFSRFNIAPISSITSLYTDGSESLWAFWYRMVRLKQMWIWVDSAGILNVDHLNYSNKISYYFGEPIASKPQASQWIKVMEAEVKKNNQTRVGAVWVFGDTGIKSFNPVKIVDPKISQWIKKPLNIVVGNASINNRAKAIKEAHEQIFEGMVGELEYTIRITDPGWIVKQNTVAFLNIPAMGIQGEFFVIGVVLTGSTDGFVQEIRLRQKHYALTQRVPASPQLKDDSINASPSGLGAALSIGRANWGEYFVVAAKAWHGGWDFSLFLATLLAICDQESSFANIREKGGPEWYPNPADSFVGPIFSGTLQNKVQQWKKDFANGINNNLAPFYQQRETGVGPMQLTSDNLKLQADKRFGLVDEYAGGRWDVASNIYIAAEYLLALSNELGLPQTEQNLWTVVAHYNAGASGNISPGTGAYAYMKSVRQKIVTIYLKPVKKAVSTTSTLPANSLQTDKQLPSGTPDKIRKMINFAERQLGKAYRAAPGETTGPDTYDCSGLVWASYNAAGLSDAIDGRTSSQNYWNGRKGLGQLFYVSKDQLKYGDMVFFDVSDSNPGEAQPGHMGLYYGDGQMIVAPHTGAVVRVESISEGLNLMGGMRVTGVWPIGNLPDNIFGG